jgi:membrane protease YdiL (CAAX protease family)
MTSPPGPFRPPGNGAGWRQPQAEGRGEGQAPLLSFTDVALVAVATIALCAILFVLILGVAAYLGGRGIPERLPSWAMPALFFVETAAIAASVYVLLIRRRGLNWRDLGLRATTRRWLVWAVVTAFACIAVGTVVTPVLDPLFDTPLVDKYTAQLGPQSVSWGQATSIFVVGGFMVPVAEEVLFRGVLYGWLRQKRGIAASALISAAVFALAHANPQVAVQIFFIGAALAYLYERSGSLIPAMVTHMTINATSLATILFYARLWG